MERLTEKYNDNYVTKNYFYGSKAYDELKTDKQNALNKLGKLEDLEEQIGCPLEVLIEAIQKGIYFTNKDDKLEYIDEALSFNTKKDSGKFVFDNYGYHCKNVEKAKFDEIYLEDYKITWWLREDKSE